LTQKETSMNRFRVAIAALGAAILVGLPVLAGGPPAPRPEPRWALNWDAALTEAKERNVPIFISFHQDG
jgi:hypothetical protein